MKIGVFDVTLLHHGSSRPFEEREVDGVKYFVSIPGKEFDVRVKVDMTYYLCDSEQLFGVFMSIDGKDVQYWKGPCTKVRLDMNELLFSFSKVEDKMFALKFTEPTFNGCPDAEDSNKDTGTIELKLITLNTLPFLICHGKEDSSKTGNIPPVTIPSVATFDKKPWKYSSTCITRGNELGCVEGVTLEQLGLRLIARSVVQLLKIPYHTSLVLTQMEENLKKQSALKDDVPVNTEGVEELPKEKKPPIVIDLTEEETTVAPQDTIVNEDRKSRLVRMLSQLVAESSKDRTNPDNDGQVANKIKKEIIDSLETDTIGNQQR